MNDLIEALQIFAKYGNPDYPTHCEHDTLMIMGICPEDVSVEDKEKYEIYYVGYDCGYSTHQHQADLKQGIENWRRELQQREKNEIN